MKKTILEIVDLIEDKDFPARRNISDYITLLLSSLNVERSLINEIESIFEEEYRKRGEQKVYSQSEFIRKIGNIFMCKNCREKNQEILDEFNLF